MPEIIRVNGTREATTPANGTDFNLKELQAIVGGYIEILPLPKTGGVIILNEEGKIDDLPVNAIATELWKTNYPIEEYSINNDELIVGDVLICASRMAR